MNTKEAINNLLTEDFFDGPKREGAGLAEAVITKLPHRVLMNLKNSLVDAGIDKIMEDPDLVSVIENYYKYNLSVSKASKNSYMHKNTFLYRFEKVYNLTGLDLRQFEDAVNFKILMQIYRLTH